MLEPSDVDGERLCNKLNILVKTAFLVATAILVYQLIENERPGFRIELEGLYLDYNFRDVGASLNDCLIKENQSALFREGRLLRSNKWYSGWSCSNVGEPEVIVSLNYQPFKKGWHFYCEQEEGEKLVGRHFNTKLELRDIEFPSTWSDGILRAEICSHIDFAIKSVAGNKRTLVHCEAGRDRAGAVSGLLSALALEEKYPSFPPEIRKALECDYRKSPSLDEHKFGRIDKFVTFMRRTNGSVAQFVHLQCGVLFSDIENFRRSFILD